MNHFSVETKTLEDVAILAPRGYLNNIMGERLEEECTTMIKKGIRKLVLNFAEIEFINSIGISILLGILDKTTESSGTLCLTNLSRLHAETFEMLGLASHLHVFPNEKEAVRYLKENNR